MRALLLNGAIETNPEGEKIHKAIIKILRQAQFHVNDIFLKEKKITPCQGCFDCWVKTPGVCIIDDYGRKIAEQMMLSDLVIHLTPIIFGGYSSELKKVIDRSIPIILPFFRKFKGEIHHKQRYEIRPSLIVIGYQDNQIRNQEETFRTLIYRNSLNMDPLIHKTLIYTKNQDLSGFQRDFKMILEEVKGYYQ
jgi:multimeric flavodoxin WrbA